MSFPGWLVVGLGNPGRKYAGTRHDLGFMLVDRLAAAAGATLSKDRDAEIGKPARFEAGEPFILVKPMAYMNLSGPPVQRVMARERVPPERVLVACDDVNLPLGKLRVRPSGSAGGHNGLRSLIEAIGEGFPRLRMGVGGEPAGLLRADWVLSRFEPSERGAVLAMLDEGEAVVEDILRGGIEEGRRRAGG